MSLIRWGSLLASVLAGLLVIVVSATALAPRMAPAPTPVASPGSAQVPVAAIPFDGEAARKHLLYIADPARRGRLTGSPGYLEAATYVADRFSEIGLEPAGDGRSFFQRFRIPVAELTAQPELRVLGPAPIDFRHRADFSEVIGGTRGGGAAEGQLVFVGGASDGPAYSDFRDVDVHGKVVLISGPSEGDPGGNALRRGPAAVLFVARDDPGPLLHFSHISQLAPNAVPTLLVTEPTADRLLASSGKRVADLRSALEQQRADPSRQPLSFETDLRVRVAVPLAVREVEAMNVVGMLRPTSSSSEKYLVVGGHLDGVGTDPDGTIYPAANDNGSGPAVTIEIARQLARQRDSLRQGVVFVAWAGEEEGLRGSAEFLRRVAGTPLSAEHLIAYLNLDVVGCCGESLAASPENASLYASLASSAKRTGVGLGVTRGSSDHETFNRAGVPAAILIWSRIGPIHTPRDTVDAVDAAHLATVGALATRTILDLAGGG